MPLAPRTAAPPLKPADSQETLAREDSTRKFAVVAAALGGLLPLAGAVLQAAIYADAELPERTSELLFIDQKGTELLLAAFVGALGAFGIAYALVFLFNASKARRPETPGVAQIMAWAGPILFGVSGIILQFAVNGAAADFAETPTTDADFDRVIDAASLITIGQFTRLAGQLGLGFAFVLISLNAMRTGLLTRFMGVLGILSGVLFVIPIGSPLPIVQAFWLFALAWLFSGRWPNGVPPAWGTGEPKPWPTQQELREQKAKQLGQKAPPPRPPGLFGSLLGGGAQSKPADSAPDAEPSGSDNGGSDSTGTAAPRDPGAARRKRKKRK